MSFNPARKLFVLLALLSLSAPGAMAGQNAFNPEISLILSGQYAHYERDPDGRTIAGVPAAGESPLPPAGLSLAESELVASANVDDRYYGRFTAALAPDGGIEVEEAFIQTLDLPMGLSLQAGRFYSELGYQNSRHAHQWDFVDQPLVYQAFLGNQYRDDGLQLRWLAPTDIFLEVGGGVFRGDAYPAGGAARNGAGTRVVFLAGGGDLGVSQSWKAGISLLDARSDARPSDDGRLAFDGTARLLTLYGVWKWAPNGNPYDRNLVVQGAWMRNEEQGDYSGTAAGSVDLHRDGAYVQAVYQFRHGWRSGLRLDRLSVPAAQGGLTGSALDPAGHAPRRASLMIDYAHSEFSRIRLQFNRDESSPQTDNQWFLQYTMSLGAHGAHRF
ncbi:MAG: hypothetical protein D6717_10430 [Gammaproteobacteria bacterium]|nr:MAG: hypothetical protein D6717_10430 [Gammaproteobacteria bacterium]